MLCWVLVLERLLPSLSISASVSRYNVVSSYPIISSIALQGSWISHSHHQLPIASVWWKVLPACEMAIHGFGWSPGNQKFEQVRSYIFEVTSLLDLNVSCKSRIYLGMCLFIIACTFWYDLSSKVFVCIPHSHPHKWKENWLIWT